MAAERVALSISWEYKSLPEMVRCARQADAAGYDTLFLAEAWGREAFSLLGYLAAQTERINLGSGIVNVYSRSAALLGMAAATLDELSGGRAVLGLGVSGKAVIEGWHGVPMEKSLARLRDCVAVVRKVVSRNRREYTGETVTVAPAFAINFTPPRPSVPIFLASTTPAAIRLLGEVADGWLPILTAPEGLAADLAEMEKGLAKAGRSRSEITVAPYILSVVDDDLAAARQPVKENIAFYVGGMGRFYHEHLTRHGFGTVADRVRELWDAREREAAVAAVSDELVDMLAVCGPAGRCRSRLDEYRRAGIDLPVVTPPTAASDAQHAATIAALAPR